MKKDNWKPIGDVAAQIVRRLEADERRVFIKECELDGVSPPIHGEQNAQEADNAA